MDTEKDRRNRRKDILIKVHEFYTEEARHQRSMMWETVKWFTPVLIAIHGWWWYRFNKFLEYNNHPLDWSLILLAFGGIALSFICIMLLKSFYRTNLIYIAMFAKVEDELSFDERSEISDFIPGDDYITYDKYRKRRIDAKKTKNTDDFIKSNFKRWNIYYWMICVFSLSILVFGIEFILFLLKA